MGYWDRFQKYMQGGPEAIDGWPDQIPIDEFNQAVGRTLGSALAENGFEPVAPRRWVRSRHDFIRDVLELQALKGTAYSPAWGFSLDFVPHVTAGGDTKWHRTPKSARFDLMYWPTDVVPPASDTLDWNMSPFATREELEDDLSRVTRLVIVQALPFFERVRAVEDLPGVYREHRSRPSFGLPFASFPQQVLASAFVLARCGDAAARRELAEYVRTYDVAPATAQKLEELLAQAAPDR
jgi:hypothetical protein